MRRLDALLAASPAPTRPQTILVGCPTEEWHTFTPLLLCLLLRRRGLNVIYLGANVPAGRFEETVAAVRADLVILAAQHLISAAALLQAAREMTAHGAVVAFGGRIFALQADLARRIPGYYLGSRLEVALETVESLLAGKSDSPQPVSPSAEYVQTLELFASHRSLIEASIDAEARARGVDPSYFTTAHKFMGDNLLACLRLGEMSYLDSEIDWLTVLLKGLNLPQSVVYDYLRLYSAVVYQHLDHHALPITNWLSHQIQPAP
jgi:methylmalonyl-CoA mutase cobalamin-binding subunit